MNEIVTAYFYDNEGRITSLVSGDKGSVDFDLKQKTESALITNENLDIGTALDKYYINERGQLEPRIKMPLMYYNQDVPVGNDIKIQKIPVGTRVRMPNGLTETVDDGSIVLSTTEAGEFSFVLDHPAYLVEEFTIVTDPPPAPAPDTEPGEITEEQITNWDTAYGWGDWSTGVDKAFVDALNVDADTLDGLHASSFAQTTGNYANLRARATTKNDVGLGLVENYTMATQAQAESGATNNRYMSPLRVAQAIEALGGSSDVHSYGTNANGSYLMFTNGVMWCWRDAAPTTWTYPAAFVSAPAVYVSASTYSFNVPENIPVNNGSYTTNLLTRIATIGLLDHGSGTYSFGQKLYEPCNALAIGEWYPTV